MILARGGHREMRKEESRVLKDISEDIDYLMHIGMPNTKWYTHDDSRRWESHAQYARFIPNPNADKYYHFGGRDDYNPNYSNKKLSANQMPSGGQMIVSRAKDASNERRINKAPVDQDTGLHVKTKDISRDADMKRVNPGFNNGDWATKYNCACCTYAYEMRRRGYDVAANGNYDAGFARNYLKYFKGSQEIPIVSHSVIKNGSPEMKQWNRYKELAAKGKNYETAKKTIRALKSQGNARGNLLVNWGAGDGHSLVYEVDNGKLTIRDCQLGKKVNPYETLSKCTMTRYVRLDNLDFDPKRIKEAVH